MKGGIEMRCTVCGRESANPEANYCDYCGTAFRTAEHHEEKNIPQQSANVPCETRVSTLMFLGVMLLPVIPVVGTVAYLVVLFYWAFASNVTDSRKSFARAMLIYTAIMLVLFFALFGSMIGAVAGGLTDII